MFFSLKEKKKYGLEKPTKNDHHISTISVFVVIKESRDVNVFTPHIPQQIRDQIQTAGYDHRLSLGRCRF